MDAQRLQPACVTTDFDKLNPRRQGVCAVVKRHAIGIDTPDQVDHILDVISMAEQPMAHVAAAGVVDFLFLNMKTGIGQQSDVSSVVIMQVRDHHILNVFRRVAQHRKCGDWTADERAPPFCGGLLVKARVDQNDPLLAANQPHVIIDRHVFVMRIVRDEVVVA